MISLFFDFKTNESALDEILQDSSNRINNIINKLLNCFSENTALDIEKVRVLSTVDTKLSIKNVLEASLADKVIDIYREPTSTINLYMPQNRQKPRFYNKYKLSFHKGSLYIPFESKLKFSFMENLFRDKYYDRIIKELKVNKVIDRY